LQRSYDIETTLVDLYSRPFDCAALVELAKANHRHVLTNEDHYGAGIGAAVAGVLGAVRGSFQLK